MDYSKFLDENFDVKEWVNAAFHSQKEGSKDQYATTLVMKLQMFIQEVNHVIEDTCQQAVQNLPRVARELEAVKQEASLLQDQMTVVRQDIQKVEHDTAKSMQILLQLDSIKSRMKDASAALKEADNWTTMSADVDEVFASKNIDAIAGKLVGMQQSLNVLTDVPDYAERWRYLEDLKNKLEAIISPQLVASFNSQSLESSQKHVKIFTDIDRLPQLNNYYHKCMKSKLLQSWTEIYGNKKAKVPECIAELYDCLLSTWHEQISWCSQVFAQPLPLVCGLLSETLTSLNPPLNSLMQNYIKDATQPITLLIDLKKISERFAKSLEAGMEQHSKESLQQACVTKLAQAVYEPYKLYVGHYSTLEENALEGALNNIPMDNEDMEECVQLLAESVNRVFAAALLANERCIEFTNGCGYVSLVQSMQVYLNSYLKEFRRVLTNLREKSSLGSATVDSEDWTLFQLSLRIIQTCGELINQTEKLDQNIVSSIVSQVGKFCQPASPVKSVSPRLERRNPFQDYQELLLDDAEQRLAVEGLITRLEQGDNPTVLEDVKQDMGRLSETAHKFAFDIVFAPLKQQLSDLSSHEIWTSQSAGGALTSNLPTFSLSPQEYITKIGQYLMTLPQQLEPFTMEDNQALKTAMKHGKLPYTAEQELPEHLADLWLESISKGTMHMYNEQILKIPNLSAHATKQLITDIEYLCNVLEDLGLPPSDTTKNICILLQTVPQEYTDVADSMPQRLASAIVSMRQLNLD